MASIRATFTLDDDLAARARELGVNVSAAARSGVDEAVRAASARADHSAYERHPEVAEDVWADAEAWSET